MKFLNALKILILTASLVLVQCTSKNAGKKQVLADGNFEDKSHAELLTPQMQVERDKYQAQLDAVEEIVISQVGKAADQVLPDLLMQKVILPLRETVLNLDVLNNPDLRYLLSNEGREIMPRLIGLFNQSLVMIYKKTPEMITKTDILTKYKEIIFWDCDKNLKGTCDFIKFYKFADPINITSIMKIIHDLESNPDEKLRIVKAAFDMKNRATDNALRFMLLERLAESFALQEKGTITRKRLRQDAELFANILKLSLNTNAQTLDYESFIVKLNPWLLSRNVDDPKNPAMTELLLLGAKFSLYAKSASTQDRKSCDAIGDKEKKFAPPICDAILELGYRIGPNFEQGVDFQYKNLDGHWKTIFAPIINAPADQKGVLLGQLPDAPVPRATARKVYDETNNNIEIEYFSDQNKKIKGNLLGDVTVIKDEYFFLVHQLYYGHYNLDDASAFWKQTKKNQKRFMQATKDFLKIQMVNNVVYTNTKMNDFYNKNENMKIIQLLKESEKEASKIRKAWMAVVRQSTALKGFLARVDSARVVDDKFMDDELEKITTSIDAMTKNIKFVVTYPNMFPLLHLMAYLESKDTISFWGMDFTIDNETVIDLFFTGKFPPWFNFGNDGTRLDETEIIHAFYFALATEIFQTYSTNTVVHFSIEEFFKVVVKKLALFHENDAEKQFTNIQTARNQFSDSLSFMKNACNEERDAAAADAKAFADAKDKNKQLTFIDALKSMSQRSDTTTIGIADLATSVYPYSSKDVGKISAYMTAVYNSDYTNAFSRMRSAHRKTLSTAEILVTIYGDYTGKDVTGIRKMIEEQLVEYRTHKAKFVTEYFGVMDDLQDCDWVFYERDRNVRHALIFREYQYLSDLYDALHPILAPLTAAQRANLPPEAAAAVEKVRRQHMAWTQNALFPADYRSRYGFTQIIGTKINTYPMDARARLISYFNELFPGQYTITPPTDFNSEKLWYGEVDQRAFHFDWSEQNADIAREKFISGGVRVFTEYMNWAKSSINTTRMFEKGNILVELFKANRLSTDPTVDCDLAENYAKPVCRKVTAKQVIEHYEKMIDFMNLDEQDLAVLNILGKHNMYEIADYEKLIKKKDEHRLYSYYDLIFKRIYSDKQIHEAEIPWFLSEPANLEVYVKSLQKLKTSTFVFPYPATVEDAFRKVHNAWLGDYFATNGEFLKEVHERVKANELLVKNDPSKKTSFNYTYTITRSFTIGETFDGAKSPYEPLLSDLIYGKFHGLVNDFNDKTSHYYNSVLDTYMKQMEADASK